MARRRPSASHTAHRGSGVPGRIETLLGEELQPPLPYEMERRLECTSRDCWLNINAGCIVIAMQASERARCPLRATQCLGRRADTEW